ncbi:hypothetical protein EJ03DRAFT_28887 [Teratosphaeria nubilosa]|uniref:Uncharacterized protein n=1 Tax=Teratosphaeria nubilosa TaxID=161662 RepID=A0A6G1LEW5_9PEZI|nr:hypothetical protein EJ03DRAFT_28887 [Teratosphaeria nubilosa]
MGPWAPRTKVDFKGTRVCPRKCYTLARSAFTHQWPCGERPANFRKLVEPTTLLVSDETPADRSVVSRLNSNKLSLGRSAYVPAEGLIAALHFRRLVMVMPSSCRHAFRALCQSDNGVCFRAFSTSTINGYQEIFSIPSHIQASRNIFPYRPAVIKREPRTRDKTMSVDR